MLRSSRKGITLIKSLVIIAILGILVGLLLPATRRVREPAARAKCMNNLKQLMLAFHNYESTGNSDASTDRSDTSPKEPLFPRGCLGPGTTPEERLSWMVALLPYLEQDSLYKQFDLEKGYTGNFAAAQTHIKIFSCSTPKATALTDLSTHYVAMSGIGLDAASQPAGASGNGFMGYDRKTSWDTFKDGTSNTIALMETRANLGPWARGGLSTLRGFDPADLPFHGDQRPFGGHDIGMSAAMADGSVRYILSSTDPLKLSAAITIAGGEPVNWD